MPLWAQAAGFSSGSTGADGAFNPTTSQTIDLPATGVFNYTSVNIPTGVTINYNKTTSNAPVVILASGDVTITGTIDVSGGNGWDGCDGLANDSGNPGLGGPGGYDGGYGGMYLNNRQGSNGLGPGGGKGGSVPSSCQTSNGGGGGGYVQAGNRIGCYFGDGNAAGGPAYGSAWLTPLLGGSGGGGGSGANDPQGYLGTGGGGGGGAIMIVASGKVALDGSINANGGNGGNCKSIFNFYGRYSGTGGGGSGGGIRIVASNFSVTNAAGLLVNGGGAGSSYSSYSNGGNGSLGYTRTETYTSGTFSFLGAPTLVFTKLNGAAVTQNPSGQGDVQLTADTPNPVTVELASSNVPIGTVINLKVVQQRGAIDSFNSTPLSGNINGATAAASVNIPMGVSTLYATASFNTTVAMSKALSTYAQGEPVEKVRLETVLNGKSSATLITATGKEFNVPTTVLAMAGVVNAN